MKKIVCIFAMVVLLSWCPAHAGFIDVLSQHYEISGNVNDLSFFESSGGSGLPLHDWIEVWDEYDLVDYAEAYADGGVTSTSAWATAHKDNGDEYSSGAFASATITFRPLVETMRITLSYMSHGTYYLDDLTSGSPVYVCEAPDPHSPWACLISLDLFHDYSFTVLATGPNFLVGNYTDASFLIETIPEPTTMLLLGLGLIGLAWVRSKFEN